MKKYFLLLLIIFLSSCVSKIDNASLYCQSFAACKNLDWAYLNEINYNNLKIKQKHNLLKKTTEEKIINDFTYIKIKATGDGDCFIRSGNFLLLERLAFSFDKEEKQKKLMHLKDALYRWWPYRKNALNDPGADKIFELIEFLANSKNIDDLLDKLNHPCIDMALVWLMRDLSLAYYNGRFKEELKKLNCVFYDNININELMCPLNEEEKIVLDYKYWKMIEQKNITKHRAYEYNCRILDEPAGDPKAILAMWHELYKEDPTLNVKKNRGLMVDTSKIHVDILYLKDLI